MKKLSTTLLFFFSATIVLFSQTIASVEVSSTDFPFVNGIYIPSGLTINGCDCYESSTSGRVFIFSVFSGSVWGFGSTGQTCATASGGLNTLPFNPPAVGSDVCDLTQVTSPFPGTTITINYLQLVPTLSQWGLIILAILLLTVGIAYARQNQMATERGNFSLSFQQLPFELNTYRNIWLMVACIIVAVFTILIQFFGYEMTQADPFGATVSSFLLAYLVFLLKK